MLDEEMILLLLYLKTPEATYFEKKIECVIWLSRKSCFYDIN